MIHLKVMELLLIHVVITDIHIYAGARDRVVKCYFSYHKTGVRSSL